MSLFRVPAMRGVIDRRILVNFRIDPEAMAAQLPEPFEPVTVGGKAIGGICLIRLRAIRPRWLPLPAGFGSENAAHRIAVRWPTADGPREGVYVPRRDTSSWLNHLVGGRIFPGVHHRARFVVEESESRFSVEMQSLDGAAGVKVDATISDRLPDHSVFESVEAVSEFFREGALGYSDTGTPGRYDGLELKCRDWSVTPLAVNEVRSVYFENTADFPEGSVTFDNALLMRGIDHEWHGQADLCCAPAATPCPAS